MEIDLGRLGRWTKWYELAVDGSAIAAYAAAINDTDPRHLAGELSPPLFGVVPIIDPIIEAQRGATPLYDQDLSLHGDHDMFVHGPIWPGTTVRTRAAFVGVRPTSSGVILLIKTETRAEDGALLNEQYLTSFYRGQRFGDKLGELAPEHRLPEGPGAPLGRVVYRIDRDQAARYAEASGDRGAYHLDEGAARSVTLPGIILHGLCTMAFTARAVVETACDGDSTRLKRLAVRFSRPVRPGQQLTTAIWAAGEADGRAVFAFEADADGKIVIQHGRAEVAP
jgi:acyl dehydratase